MHKIEQIDEVVKMLQGYKKDIKKKDIISKKLSEGYQNFTRKRIGNMNADLNWICIDIDKQSKRIWAKMLEYFETDLGEREYNPSPFHSYKG